MHDQAARLRERLQRSVQTRPTRLVTVTSGKGGVGKSNFTLNFALGLMEKGQKVVIFDVDLGLANLDVLMGISPKMHLLHLLEPDRTIWDILEKGPNGLEFIAGGSGFTQILQFDDQKLDTLFSRLEHLQGYADTVFFDTGAGISHESLRFMLSSDEVLLVTTPEPTAITDAYAVIKMIHSKNPHARIRLIINRVGSRQEGKNTADKLSLVAKRFLGMEIGTLGYIPDDASVSKAVKQQKPFFLSYPNSQAAKGIRELVDAYLDNAARNPQNDGGGLRGFLSKMKNLIR
ncbi:MinD/ParA family protein [Brevibacillus sp. SYP-B805]|uniref:MinD/ParA family protein n=1 Tax=Brevibacillus sp. SYP-B805 TaxID=1578199 RepID=UPI0013EB2E57|nr:MinD/ParA family protein [Brevibacillus sp. SYP-B805]NGQ94026.1 MinD/ParA family protein [Brevibacillus sp. SYP-B805]